MAQGLEIADRLDYTVCLGKMERKLKSKKWEFERGNGEQRGFGAFCMSTKGQNLYVMGTELLPREGLRSY